MKKDPFQKREAKNYENPVASREFILEQLEAIGEPVAFKRLAKTLSHESSSEREALKHRLSAMVRDGQLVVDRRNVYAIARRMELLTGKISAHPDGYGFLLQEGSNEDIFLTGRQMRQVFHGDVAKVQVRGKDRRGRSEGEIVEVLERHTQQLVGRYYVDNDVALLDPLNNRINHEIILRNESDQVFTEGQIVVAEIIEQPSLRGVAIAEVVEVLGDHLTPGIEVEIALRGNDIPNDWPEEVVEMVDQMPSAVTASDKKNRFDLTELPFVTIDGEDARDFDDAVYCEPRETGGWRLYVAIADVSHYVQVDNDLDRAAYLRGTSVYFPQYVVPMLPEKLSNGLCSLNPHVERLVMVCEMTISAKGRVSGFEFYEGFIHSHARLTYTQVAAVIGDPAFSTEENIQQRTELEAVVPHIDELHRLYKTLLKTRQARGAIEFETTELAFEFGDDGRVKTIVPRSRNTAHKVIEECMLAANVCAARFVTKHKKPGLFRVHEPPALEKVESLAQFLARFGITFQYDELVKPADYQQVIKQLRERENGQVLQMSLLRSMNQAVYQVENNGHFGLGYAEYTHFTSPIRRYPDLLTHRLIKSVIHSKTESRFVARLGNPSKIKFYPYEIEQVIEFGANTSFTERRAESAVYEVLEWIKCDYISDRVGDVLDGVITGVTKFGFFVELKGIFVEGLVHISTLANDYFRYDPGPQCLVGERTHLIYGMGDPVQVQVTRVNVDERKIDFELVSHTALMKPTKREGAGEGPDKEKLHKKRNKHKKNRKRKSKHREAAPEGATQSSDESGSAKKHRPKALKKGGRKNRKHQ